VIESNAGFPFWTRAQTIMFLLLYESRLSQHQITNI
jgi:hypothetical protein